MQVLEIFDSIQGEGVWAGTPMTFVRFAGCNAPALDLGCVTWCDTPDGWSPAGGQQMSAADVGAAVAAAGLSRVCLTGGEPLLQGEEFGQLVCLLREAGRQVHVETNGTLDLPGGCVPDWVTVSPKPPEYTVSPGLAGRIGEIKVVVDGSFREETAESLHRAHPEAVLCLQPEWALFESSSASALSAVLSHPGWRLSIQLHKVLGIR